MFLCMCHVRPDPISASIEPMSEAFGELYEHEKDNKWALVINEPVERELAPVCPRPDFDMLHL